MLRKAILGIALFSGLLLVTGCGPEKKPRGEDMPVTASPGIDPKTGKASRMMEVSIEDPAVKKK
jgi:hypothetical protein